MINVWDYQEVEGKIKVICTDGAVFIGYMGDVCDVEEESEDGFKEDSITVWCDGVPVGLCQSEIESIEIL